MSPSGGTGDEPLSSVLVMENTTYFRLLTDAARTGRCPMWISLHTRQPFGPPPDPRHVLADLDTRDAADILTRGWPPTSCPCCLDRLDPFRNGFPGLLTRPPADPEEARWHAARVAANHPWRGEPDMVAATRPADVPALIGWTGPCNAWDDMVALSAVLRSWEERFGTLAYCINGATLHLSVAVPPVTEEDSLQVAAEHLAFCVDAFETYTGQMSTDTLREYARRIQRAPEWRFWWD